MNRQSVEVHKYWLQTIITEADYLDDWDRDFLNNMKFHLDRGFPISDKQESKLEQIYERVTR